MMASLFTGGAALAVLPALFSLLGRRIGRTDLPFFPRSKKATADSSNGLWVRLGRILMVRPRVVALLSSLLLIGLTLPALGIRLTAIGVTSLPPSADARIFATHLRNQFEHPIMGEISVAIHGHEAAANRVYTRLQELEIRSKEGSLFPLRLKHSARLWQANINPAGPVFSDEAKQLVLRLRSMKAPIMVGGETASFIDTLSSIDRHLPWVIALLALSSSSFVFLATGSLILPVKALIMNLLALGAALGVVVLIFQHGLLQGPLGFHSEGALAMTPPIVIVASAFGLLTDYGLFLLMRIKEQREAGTSDEDAVVLGLQRTGRVITAAAILLCVAVGAFGTSQVVFIKASSVGILAAVLLDAFVIRLLLVPSLMVILGKWNWWPRSMSSRSS
jgi:RND superfamily putative drug exporter